MSTLSEYNNNPGNIRPAKGVHYEGMIGVDDKGFAIFETPKFGQQALVNDVAHKIGVRKINTPSDFVDVYAPAGKENSEEARDNYKMHIADQLGLKRTNDPFPENSIDKLAQAIAQFEGGTWKNGDQGEASPSTTVALPGAPAAAPANAAKTTETEPPSSINPLIGAGFGAMAGATTASGIETGKKALPLVQALINKATGSTDYMNKPQSRASLQKYLNSQIAPDLRIPLSELEKIAGNGNPVRTMSEVQDALANIKEVPEQKVTKPVYKPQAYGSKTLMDTGKVLPTTIPGRQAIDLSAYKHNPTVVTRAIDQAANAADIVKGALPSVARIGVGALGGALAGSQLYDALNQYRQEGKGLHMPSARNAAQLASSAGGALSMLPFGVTQGAGLALQAPELAYQGYENLKELNERRKAATREDTNRMLTNVDPMGNPIP